MVEHNPHWKTDDEIDEQGKIYKRKYEEDMKKYNEDLIKYEKLCKVQYEKDLAEYNIRLEEYQRLLDEHEMKKDD